MLVTDASGTIRFASDNGLRLLLLATVSEITPSILKSAVGEGATRTIKALCARLEAGARGLEKAPSAITLDSKWGRFVLRGYRLCDGRAREARIGLRIQRQVPMILRFVKAMARQPLSPQQREIALQIALGRSNAEISDRLGVTLNTVAYHVKQLFLRLDVHTRTEAVEKIAWGQAAVT
jgi:DNA-binding CsgD family transcriptional regulator